MQRYVQIYGALAKGVFLQASLDQTLTQNTRTATSIFPVMSAAQLQHSCPCIFLQAWIRDLGQGAHTPNWTQDID